MKCTLPLDPRQQGTNGKLTIPFGNISVPWHCVILLQWHWMSLNPQLLLCVGGRAGGTTYFQSGLQIKPHMAFLGWFSGLCLTLISNLEKWTLSACKDFALHFSHLHSRLDSYVSCVRGSEFLQEFTILLNMLVSYSCPSHLPFCFVQNKLITTCPLFNTLQRLY